MGRIVRDETGEFAAIVEEKDATPAERAITEVNMSTYVFDCCALLAALDQLRNDNRQGEYYITDCPGILRGAGKDVRALPVSQPCEALSVNNLAISGPSRRNSREEVTVLMRELRSSVVGPTLDCSRQDLRVSQSAVGQNSSGAIFPTARSPARSTRTSAAATCF